MPIILGKDGPSLGGFVCIATIAEKEFWKVGQAQGGDTIEFYPIENTPPLIKRKQFSNHCVSYRRSGESHILVCYGVEVMDLALRCRIHLLMEKIKDNPNILEMSPGVQSVQFVIKVRKL